MSDLGSLALALALVISIYALAGYVIGIRTSNSRLLLSAKGGVLAVGLLTVVASILLWYLLLVGDFSVDYVYSYTSTDLPIFYKLSAFWAGNAGSLLLWALLLSIYTIMVSFAPVQEDRRTNLYATAVLLINSAFFLAMLVFIANPFALTAAASIPLEGRGLNPLLQHPGMVFHPVTLYLGYVGFAVPFAFAMAALLTRKADDHWIKITRRWSVIAWMFLSLGNLYGGQWAYVELGWGGFWGWDPVENASFIPWLTATAFIHSVMVQERKDMLKTWNMVLVIITYALTIFGTFLVRSGVLTSVHAFGDSDLGTYFLIFMGLMLVGALYILIDRIGLLQEGHEFQSFLSKESSFLINNLLLVGAAFAVFWGTVFPLVSEAIRGVKVTVSAPFFDQVTAPILLATLFVMGVCPLIAWQKASWKNLIATFKYPLAAAIATGAVIYWLQAGARLYPTLGFAVSAFVVYSLIQEVVRGALVRSRMTGESLLLALGRLVIRNRRRYGGYVVHFGLVLMAVGVVGAHAYTIKTTQTVAIGQHIQLGDYTLTYQGLGERPEGVNTVVFANLPVVRTGTSLGKVSPEKVFYANWDQPSTEVSILGGLKEDLYVVLAGWEQGGSEATFEVHVNPLVSWVWIGGYILILGTIFAVWPGRGSQLGPKYTRGGLPRA